MERNFTIVISGYYGFGNSGDEAVLHAILQSLREQADAAGIRIRPVVLSIDPSATERMHGVRAVHRMKLGDMFRALKESDGLVSGGGSLLQDLTGIRTIPYYLGVIKLAQWLGKPTFIYAQGMGPIRNRMYYPMIRGVFRRCAYISMRDEESVQLLRDIGLRDMRIDVAADPVMGLRLPAAEGAAEGKGPGDAGAAIAESAAERPYSGPAGYSVSIDEPLIGVAAREWHDERRDLNQLAEALRLVLERRPNARLRFLPFHPPKDEAAARYIMHRLGESYAHRISMCPGSDDPKRMFDEVGRCSLLIGMRLHSLIYAASLRIPMVGISYDPKIDYFLRRLQMPVAGSTLHIEPEHLAAQALQLLDERDQWIAAKSPLIEELQKKSQIPAQHICQYLRNRG